MLMKELGNLRIDKIHALLLIDEYYNWIYNILARKIIIPSGDSLGIIPKKDFGRRLGHRAVKFII